MTSDSPVAPEPPDPATSAARLSVGRTVDQSISRAFRIWTRNFVPVSLLVLLVNAPYLVLLSLLRGGALGGPWPRLAEFAVLLVLPRLFESIAAGVVTYGVVETLRGRPATTATSVARGLGRVEPALSASLLAIAFVAAGTALLIVPGIILACGLFVTVPVAVIEGTGGLAALKRSWVLTKGARLGIFAALCVFNLIDSAVGTVGARLFGHSYGAFLGESVVSLVLRGGLSAVFAPVLYHDLRATKEGTDIEELARVFD